MRVPRATRVRQINDLRALGLSYKEIARQLGLSPNTCMTYANDPTGKFRAERKERQRRPCPCGRAMILTPEALRCVQCRNEVISAERVRWTPARVVGGFQRFYFEHGLPPTQDNIARYQTENYPSIPAVVRHFGSWEAGVRAAGFKPWKHGDGPRKAFG